MKIAAIKLDDRCWVVAEELEPGSAQWQARGCRTLGRGVGSTPQAAAEDACRYGGYARCHVYRTRKEALGR